MPDAPRLEDDAIPPDVVRSEFFWHIVETLGFPPDDQRIMPATVRANIEALGADGKPILEALELLSGFLKHTFVFDNLQPEAREALRTRMEREDPTGSRWYEQHMLRLNKITTVGIALMTLEQYVGAMLRRAMEVEVSAAVDALNAQSRNR